jgi:integrase
MQEVIGSTPIFSTTTLKGAESEQNSLLSPLVSAKTQTQLPIDLSNTINAIGMFKNYTEPFLSKGKAVKTAPKGSTKAKEEAKQNWFINFSFFNPVTGKMQRFRKTRDGNRIKDLDKKVAHFNALKAMYEELLSGGWNPIDEESNAELRRTAIAITLVEGRDLFKAYHQSKGSRPKSISTYLSKVNALIEHFGAETKANEITDFHITTFLNHQEATLGWIGTTYVNSKIALNNYFRYLTVNKYIPANPVTNTETRKKIKTESHQVFNEDDFKLIMDWLNQKDAYAALFCKSIYYTCIRPKELRHLQLKHMDMKKGTITVPANIAKNKKALPVSIDPSLMLELNKLQIDKQNPESYLFGSTSNIIGSKRIGDNTPYDHFQRCLKDLELLGRNYTLYSFKHTSNVKKFKSGWSLAEICAANRHSSIAETETYLKDLLKDVKHDKVIPPI